MFRIHIMYSIGVSLCFQIDCEPHTQESTTPALFDLFTPNRLHRGLLWCSPTLETLARAPLGPLRTCRVHVYAHEPPHYPNFKNLAPYDSRASRPIALKLCRNDLYWVFFRLVALGLRPDPRKIRKWLKFPNF